MNREDDSLNRRTRKIVVIAGVLMSLIILAVASILLSRKSEPKSASSRTAKFPADPYRVPTDEEITSTVERQLAGDPEITETGIQVRTEDRVVMLTGFVLRESEKQRAEEIAKSTLGVNQVVNGIRVAVTPLTSVPPSVPQPPAASRPIDPKKPGGPRVDPKKPGGPRKN